MFELRISFFYKVLIFLLLKNTAIYRTKVYGKKVQLVPEISNLHSMLTTYCT